MHAEPSDLINRRAEATNRIENLGDLVGAAGGAAIDLGPPDSWWRGLGSVSWDLHTALARHPHPKREVELACIFQNAAYVRRENCPKSDQFVDWICLMQHYGLPTRMLDWSASILVAAFFAVAFNPQPGDAALWALNPGLLNEAHAGGKFMLNHKDKSVIEAASGAFCYDVSCKKAMAFDLVENDLRHLAQQARATIHGTLDPLNKLPGADTFLRKYIIPAAAKERLAGELRVMRFNLSTLFPDLDHLAQHVRTLPW